jgi:hypothetical protein
MKFTLLKEKENIKNSKMLGINCFCGMDLNYKFCWYSFSRSRIAPPEAPVSGYRFGKGCYFADMSSKSLNTVVPLIILLLFYSVK